jgi:hypothetical protein
VRALLWVAAALAGEAHEVVDAFGDPGRPPSAELIRRAQGTPVDDVFVDALVRADGAGGWTRVEGVHRADGPAVRSTALWAGDGRSVVYHRREGASGPAGSLLCRARHRPGLDEGDGPVVDWCLARLRGGPR